MIKVQSIWIDFKKLSLPLDKINPLKLNFLTEQNVSSRVKNKDITIFHFVYLFLILRSVQEYCILSRNGKNPLTRTSFFTIKCPETAKQVHCGTKWQMFVEYCNILCKNDMGLFQRAKPLQWLIWDVLQCSCL